MIVVTLRARDFVRCRSDVDLNLAIADQLMRAGAPVDYVPFTGDWLAPPGARIDFIEHSIDKSFTVTYYPPTDPNVIDVEARVVVEPLKQLPP